MAKSKIFGEIWVIWIEIPLKGFSGGKFMFTTNSLFPQGEGQVVLRGQLWEVEVPGGILPCLFKMQLFHFHNREISITVSVFLKQRNWSSWEEYCQQAVSKCNLFTFTFVITHFLVLIEGDQMMLSHMVAIMWSGFAWNECHFNSKWLQKFSLTLAFSKRKASWCWKGN